MASKSKAESETYRRFPQFPNVSTPSSRFASRFASFECSSSPRVFTAGIVCDLDAAGGADCDGGGGDVDAPGPYVPCRLKETGLAACGGADCICICGDKEDVETAREGAKGLFELYQMQVKSNMPP